jgi:signal transduction histidine kinase
VRTFVAWLGRITAEPLPTRIRDAAAVVVALACFTAGTWAFVFGTSQSGIHLETDANGYTYIASIDDWSPARGTGIQPGYIVTSFNDQPLIALPGGDPAIKSPVQPPTWEPTFTVDAIPPGDLAALESGDQTVGWASYSTDEWALQSSATAPIAGVLILVLGSWWLASGAAGETLRRIAIPVATAAAAPLLLVPVALTWTLQGTWAIAVLLPLSTLLLADGLSTVIEAEDERRGARILAGVLAMVALGAGLAMLSLGGSGGPPLVRWLAAGAASLFAGLIAAGPFRRDRLAAGRPAGGWVVDRAELVAAGATPLVAGTSLVRPEAVLVLPVLIWIAALLVAQRFTIRPLARVATRATAQRDLVVAATEAERARIATHLHDDALQDLTMLIHRLDAAGDTANADSARAIAEQLRAITGELRLPLLDDLGTGPALEWLVARVEPLAGGPVRLDREDEARPPADVELAFFRVAQEALANAVKHGRPPIQVRYRASVSGVSLTVDDAGNGIEGSADAAAETARLAGHFGLMGMQQRAEQIGAILDVRRWPAGGTHVALEWRPR